MLLDGSCAWYTSLKMTLCFITTSVTPLHANRVPEELRKVKKTWAKVWKAQVKLHKISRNISTNGVFFARSLSHLQKRPPVPWKSLLQDISNSLKKASNFHWIQTPSKCIFWKGVPNNGVIFKTCTACMQQVGTNQRRTQRCLIPDWWSLVVGPRAAWCS